MIEPHPGTLPTSLSEFALYAQALRGDEKGESGILLENRVTRPQSPTNRQIEKVAEAAVALRRLRREIMTRHNWSLRELYRTLETPGANPLRTAQESLDRAVREAYNMPATADILAFLLNLNLTLAAQESNNHPIQTPGLPASYPTPEKLVTEDCIRVESKRS